MMIRMEKQKKFGENPVPVQLCEPVIHIKTPEIKPEASIVRCQGLTT
jgi:hypothetical protein